MVMIAIPVFASTSGSIEVVPTDGTNNVLSTIQQGILIPLIPVLAGFIIAFFKKKMAEIEHNIKNSTATKYGNMAEDAVCTAVTAVTQTYVDELKSKGTFDQAAKEEAFALSKQKALSILGTTALKTLSEAYTDFDAWLESKIEFYVNVGKANIRTVSVNNAAPIPIAVSESALKSIPEPTIQNEEAINKYIDQSVSKPDSGGLSPV